MHAVGSTPCAAAAAARGRGRRRRPEDAARGGGGGGGCENASSWSSSCRRWEVAPSPRRLLATPRRATPRIRVLRGDEWKAIAPPGFTPSALNLSYDEHEADALFERVTEVMDEVDVDAQSAPGGGVKLTASQKRALDAFWLSCGVASASHRASLVREGGKRGLFRDPRRVVERVTELEDSLWRAVGISEIDVGLCVGRFPKVLFFEPDFLIERLRLLRDLLPNVNLRKVIERNPQVLGMDMTCTLPAKMRELSVLLPHVDVIHLIETHPKILSTNVSGNVAGNLRQLKRLMSEVGVEDIGVEMMVTRAPRLLTSDVDGTVRERMRAIERASPGTFRRYADKPASAARMLCASEKVIDRIAFLHETVEEGERGSEIAAVNAPAGTFSKKHPGFEAWQRERSKARERERSADTGAL